MSKLDDYIDIKGTNSNCIVKLMNLIDATCDKVLRCCNEENDYCNVKLYFRDKKNNRININNKDYDQVTKRYIVQAINKEMPLLINIALQDLQNDIDEARAKCREEAKNTLVDLELDKL